MEVRAMSFDCHPEQSEGSKILANRSLALARTA